MLWTLIRSYVALTTMGTIGMAMFAGIMMGIIIHVVLFIVVATSNKDAYPTSPSL